MTYNKQNFEAKQILTATALNMMDDQIFANAESLTELLAKDYATVEQLATKQDVGSYVTVDDLSQALEGKQDVGDYLTQDDLPESLADRLATLESQLAALTKRVAALESLVE